MAALTPVLVQRAVSLAGLVTTTPGGQPLGGARVAIATAPPAFTDWLAVRAIQFGDTWDNLVERPDRKITNSEGRFWFLNLPPGTYALSIMVPGDSRRFGTGTALETVPSDSALHLAVSVPVTAVSGTVKSASGALARAEVRMKGSGEATFTKADGSYLLTGMQAGQRTVVATAPTFAPASAPVTLTVGVTKDMVNFTLNLTPVLPPPPAPQPSTPSNP